MEKTISMVNLFYQKKGSELNPFCLLTLLSRSSFCFAKQMLPNKLKWVIKMQSAHSIDAIINNFPVTRDRITWFVDQSSQTTPSIGKKIKVLFNAIFYRRCFIKSFSSYNAPIPFCFDRNTTYPQPVSVDLRVNHITRSLRL